jgi:hypothetical protein
MNRRQNGIFLDPVKERFIWREWAVPFFLAATVASLVIARAVLAPAPIVLNVPVAAPSVVARPAQQAAALATGPPPSGQPAEEPLTAQGVRVMLRCEGTTWVEASSDGAEARRYALGPGANLALAARERLSLSLGDAGLIRLKVNERDLGFIGDKGETKVGLSFTAPKAPAAAATPATVGD